MEGRKEGMRDGGREIRGERCRKDTPSFFYSYDSNLLWTGKKMENKSIIMLTASLGKYVLMFFLI